MIGVGTDRGVRTLTLDSPGNRNALSSRLLGRLRDELAAAAAAPRVRVVVLDHAGPAFCAGADLTEVRTDPAGLTAAIGATLADLWEFPKPVVARVAGPARGGGLGLIATADIALCSSKATFAFSEVRLGVVPAVISPVMSARLDRRTVARLYLTGEVFDAARAVAAGLISEAITPGGLDRAVSRVCQDLLRGAPGAVAGIKRLLRRGELVTAQAAGHPQTGLREVLAELASESADSFRSAEAREGIAAFRERRDPAWVEPATDPLHRHQASGAEAGDQTEPANDLENRG